MNLFKTFTLKWWQAGFFKLGMLAAGIALGAYLHDLFAVYLAMIVAIAIACLAYVSYVWLKQ